MAQQSQPLRAEDLHVSPARARTQRILRSLFFVAATLALFISLGIVLSLLNESIAFITNVDLPSLVNGIWEPRSLRFDIPTLIAGSFVIAIIGMLIAAPLGLGAAIYLAEYASPRVRGWLKPILEILASIPSVVLGFFALSVLSPTIIDPICPGPTIPFNMLSAGLAVGILITPLVASIAEDALYAVPSSLREASYGLGARKRTTTLRVVFPAAVSGIVAALIIGLSRAVGETMIVSIAAGGTGGAAFNINPCLPGQTMTAAMVSLAIGSDQSRAGEVNLPYESLFFVGLLLFVMTLVLNLVSESYVRRARKKGAI
jgi:phosphate transport system permease protein